MTSLFDIIKELCETPGIAGYERRVAEVLERLMIDNVDAIKVDTMGNLVARKGDDEEAKLKVLVTAHMDEIGLMVKNIDENGFINFVKVGGIDDKLLIGRKVIIHGKEKVFGVIGVKPPHLEEKEEEGKIPKYKEMFIDIGANDKKDAEKYVSIGDPITFYAETTKLVNDLITGKAFDDRLGCAVLVKLAEYGYPDDICVYLVGTSQEEVGLKGARTIAYKLKPDIAIAIDTTPAGDYPFVKSENIPVKVGKGPVIEVLEAGGRGVISHPKVVEWLRKVAEAKKIPYQINVGDGGMTDAAIMYITRAGIPSCSIGIATRYIHSQVEVASLKDVENTIKLLAAALENISLLKLE